MTQELSERIIAIAEELSELWSEFSADFEFGTVEFKFTQKASEIE